jgi:hypothetical protein
VILIREDWRKENGKEILRLEFSKNIMENPTNVKQNYQLLQQQYFTQESACR